MTSKLLKDTSYSAILKVSTPMIFSALSENVMQIIGRILLARYSEIALSSANVAWTWCSTIYCSMISIIFIAGAFVGNYNGAGKYKFASVPVWQMIWFSISTLIISIPAAYLLAPYCVPKNLQAEGISYFKIMFAATPLFCVRASLSLFFIAIGKGYIITISVLFAAVINLITDLILIFGHCGITQFMGATGAAIGTIFGTLSGIAFLAFNFYKKKIREKYGTLNCKLRLKRLKKYLKLGFLASIGHIVEAFILSFVVFFLSSISNEMALIQSISSTLYVFFMFFVSGLEKGIMSIASNLLGANMREKINLLLRRALIMQFGIAIIFAAIILAFPMAIIELLKINSATPELIQQITLVLGLMMITFLVDGIIWIEAGILEAGGDVNYMMGVISISNSIFVAIPAFILVCNGAFSVVWSWILYSIANSVSAFMLYKRYKSNRWVHINV